MPATSSIKSMTRPTPTPSVRKGNNAQSQMKDQTPIVETVESDIFLPSQPPAATTQPQRKRGRKPKASKEKWSMAEGSFRNRDAFLSRGVSNDRPAITQKRRKLNEVNQSSHRELFSKLLTCLVLLVPRLPMLPARRAILMSYASPFDSPPPLLKSHPPIPIGRHSSRNCRLE